MDKLSNWRKHIDALDEKLLQIIAERNSAVKKIGEFKKKKNLPFLDKKRWNDVMISIRQKAKSLNLSDSFITKLFTLIHHQSLKIEKDA